MAFDAFFLTAVLEEVRRKCTGARVDKIHQPSRDTLILHLRGRESREKLLFAANPTAPRLHLTAASPENPAEPPMFCMLLRKHLLGAKLAEISQPPMERAAVFTFDCTDEMGYPVQKRLVAELMGRTCNLYLLSPEGRILDCLRRIGLDETSRRPALPGLMYQDPEPVKKENPAVLDNYVNLLTQPGADLLSDRLMDNLGGLSPLVCREAALFAAGSTDARVSALNVDDAAEKLALFFHEHLNHPKPYVYALRDGTPKQNAAKYYKDYARMKNAEKELTHQLELGRTELDYLKSVLEELNRAGTEAELEEIRRELQEGGYLRPDTGKKRVKQSKLPPMRFESTDGYPIYVGRNNRQNDELTFKLARKDDIWCHASKVHGSHVIISCGGTTPPDNTVTQAAQLAAYYAETGGGQNIPVDVTDVKQVKKIPNGKPGMVIYHTYRTVIANPYPDIVVDELNAEKTTN